jgi:hypothetical protein
MILVLFIALGCGSSSPEGGDDYLIRLGGQKVTGHEFLQAFELVKTAHPDSVHSNAPELQHARRRLLDEMTLDLILVKHSQEVGVAVSPDELDAAVAAVMADYPPGVFEQTLIDSALPFETWKKRLHSRLLMEKLVGVELQPLVAITEEDIRAYYQQNYSGKASGAYSEEKFERLKGVLVSDLRQAKTEEAFNAWIDGLRKKYAVEVNARLWERIVEPGPKSASSPPEAAEPGK